MWSRSLKVVCTGKAKEYHHHAKINIYYVYSVRKNRNVKVFDPPNTQLAGQLASWCFETSQPLRILSGLTARAAGLTLITAYNNRLTFFRASLKCWHTYATHARRVRDVKDGQTRKANSQTTHIQVQN